MNLFNTISPQESILLIKDAANTINLVYDKQIEGLRRQFIKASGFSIVLGAVGAIIDPTWVVVTPMVFLFLAACLGYYLIYYNTKCKTIVDNLIESSNTDSEWQESAILLRALVAVKFESKENRVHLVELGKTRSIINFLEAAKSE